MSVSKNEMVMILKGNIFMVYNSESTKEGMQ